jgi:hypothetical protein
VRHAKVGENKPAVQAREQERERRERHEKNSFFQDAKGLVSKGFLFVLENRLTNLNVQQLGIAPPRDSSLKKIHPKSKGLDFKLL